MVFQEKYFVLHAQFGISINAIQLLNFQTSLLKILYGFAGILLSVVFLFVIYDTTTGTKYSNKIASGNILSNDEYQFLNSRFGFDQNEKIQIIYGYGKSISDGAIILTNARLINYIEGEGGKEAQQVMLKHIKSVELQESNSITEQDLITVIDKNSFSITLSIIHSENIGQRLISRIRNSMDK